MAAPDSEDEQGHVGLAPMDHDARVKGATMDRQDAAPQLQDVHVAAGRGSERSKGVDAEDERGRGAGVGEEGAKAGQAGPK